MGRPGELREGGTWGLLGLSPSLRPPVWQRHHEPRWRELETGGLGGRPGHQEVVAAQSPAGHLCHCHCRCVTPLFYLIIILTVAEARMSSSESSEEEQGGDSEVRK